MPSLEAKRCIQCGHVSFPGHHRCSKCRGTAFAPVPLEEGRLVNYTILHATGKGVERPLKLGLIDFGNGAKMIAQIACDSPSLGMKMRPVYSVLRSADGKEYRGFRFEPST